MDSAKARRASGETSAPGTTVLEIKALSTHKYGRNMSKVFPLGFDTSSPRQLLQRMANLR
jgi:hypothetical protein